jgi:uncharacterized protein (TIGR00299 family) protein
VNKLVLVDTHICGISGDMFLSSLVNAGANKDKIIKKISIIEKEFPGSKILELAFKTVRVNGIQATRLSVSVEEEIKERKALEMLRIIKNCCKKVEMSKIGTQFVTDSLKVIITAESYVHGLKPKYLHLHESSSIDTGIDLIGSAIALEDLGLLEDTKFLVSSVAVGGGFTEFSHGKVSNPTSAVLEILRFMKIPIIGGPVPSETTTPTGAAILFGLKAETIEYYPEFVISGIGCGTGAKVFEKVPNILRVCIGNSPLKEPVSKDLVSVLETNIDDISGEVIGYLIEKIAKCGDEVKDVTIVNGLTKKNRPVHILKVICSIEIEMKVINLIFLETGSLGIRRLLCERFKLDRYSLSMPVEINNVRQTISIKVAKDSSGNVIGIKPEYEDIKKLSLKSGISFKETQNRVNILIFQNRLNDIKS